MDAIFTWKNLSTAKELQSTFFWHYAKISVQTASKYHKTILYTDTKGAKQFKNNGIGFDEVIILKEIEDITGSLICIPKIYTMLQRTEPYVHLDFDIFTNSKYHTYEPIAFGYPEVDSKNFLSLEELRYLNNNYLNAYEKEFYMFFDSKNWDWRLVPNFGVFIVNNPSLVKDIFSKILKKIERFEPESSTKHEYASFIEQFLFMRYVEEFDIDYEFIYDKPPFIFKDSNFVYVKDKMINVSYKSGISTHLNTLKFAHFHGYRKFPTFSNTIIKKLITKENPI